MLMALSEFLGKTTHRSYWEDYNYGTQVEENPFLGNSGEEERNFAVSLHFSYSNVCLFSVAGQQVYAEELFQKHM